MIRFILFIFFCAFNLYAGQRVVSLAPSVTEVVYKLGGGDRLVGVTNMCDYPPEAKKIDKVGSYFRPSVEKIVSLRPDLVLGMEEGFTASVKDRLDTVGIKNGFYKAQNLNDIIFLITDIGKRLNLPSKSVTDRMKKVFAVKPPVKAKGIMIVNIDPVIAVGGGVFINDILACGGFDNLLKSSTAKYPRLSLEGVYKLNPDYVLYSRMDSVAGINILKAKLDRTGLKTKYLALDPDLFNRASYRVADACLFLRESFK